MYSLVPVLRIHVILGWIRIRGSMPLTNVSGSWIRILLFSSLTFKMPAKNKFFNTIFSAYDFLKLHLHHFSKKKNQKESQNSRNQGLSYYFCMMIEGSGARAGSGSIPLTSGSGSGSWRPKNTWIRWIRIRKTDWYKTIKSSPFMQSFIIKTLKVVHSCFSLAYKKARSCPFM